MVVCDGCKRESESDNLIPIAGLLLCVECLEPYESEARFDSSLREMDMLERRIRSDILKRNRKVR